MSGDPQDGDDKKRDEVLKRMLQTPPKKHDEKRAPAGTEARPRSRQKDDKRTNPK